MGDLERLVAIEAIKSLKARYYRFLDSHDWDGFESVFTRDAVMDVRVEDRIIPDEDGVYRGRQAIRAFAEAAVGTAVTIDRATMPEIEIVSPTEATAIWAQEDRVFWPEGAPNRQLHGWGYEHDVYAVEDGAWRMASTKLVRTRTEMQRA